MAENKDFHKEVEKIVQNAGNDATKIPQSFSKICGMLANEPDTAIRLMFIKEIASNYDYSKGELNNAVNALLKKRNADSKEQGESTTLIDIQEKAIGLNFDIQFNEISLDWEITEYATNEPATFFDILRNLKKQNIQISEGDLKIILKSKFIDITNPIRDYFELLPEWNGEIDHIEKLTNYIQVNEYDKTRFKAQFKKALIRSIACSLEKDFNKHCLVLVGDGTENQNTGKTSFIRWLAPPDLKKYYLEDLPGDSKDSLRGLAENFIINLDELESLWRTEKNKLKSIFSKDYIKVRVQYDRNWSTIKRRANFWASTNETEFLTDLTGNVRWLAFKLAPVAKPINWKYSTDPETDIHKIWAQAYQLFKDGEAYKLSPKEVDENEQANDQFLSLPPEYDLLQIHYSPASQKKHDGFYTSTDFLKQLIDKSGRNIKMNSVSLGRVLRKLGYQQQNGHSSTVPTKSMYQVKGYYININTHYEKVASIENILKQNDTPLPF
jgi:hypothetical protein